MNNKLGKDFENGALEILEGYGYKISARESIHVYANQRPWQVDLRVTKGNDTAVIELKHQESGGSAYEKVDFACRKLTKVASRTKAKKALMVYSGRKMERFMHSHPLAQEMKRDYANIEFISYG
mgnify:CR=1 FL=1